MYVYISGIMAYDNQICGVIMTMAYQVFQIINYYAKGVMVL